MESKNNESKKALWTSIAIVLVVIIAIILILLLNGRKYTITFDNNTGEAVYTEKVKRGDLLDAPKDPKRDGYVFLGWYLDDEEFDFSKPIKADLKLEARWQKLGTGEKFSIKFDDGKKVQTVETDGDGYIKEIEEPVRKGYVFLGWYNGNKKFDFTKPVTKDMTLVAKWKKETSNNSNSNDKNPTTPQVKKYTVKFIIDGNVTATLVKEGEKITLPKTPTKDGYTFKGWYVDGASVDENTIVNNYMEIIGVWDEYTFKLELIDNDKTSPNVLVKTYKNGKEITVSAIYGKLNGKDNYRLGEYSNTYKAIKVVSKAQFELASSYKIDLDGNKLYINKK